MEAEASIKYLWKRGRPVFTKIWNGLKNWNLGRKSVENRVKKLEKKRQKERKIARDFSFFLPFFFQFFYSIFYTFPPQISIFQSVSNFRKNRPTPLSQIFNWSLCFHHKRVQTDSTLTIKAACNIQPLLQLLERVLRLPTAHILALFFSCFIRPVVYFNSRIAPWQLNPFMFALDRSQLALNHITVSPCKVLLPIGLLLQPFPR